MNSFSHNEDNYHPEHRYREHLPGEDGFARFHDPDNDQWYFAWFHNGDLILRSEGYTNEAARDNGLESVKQYMGDDENYNTEMLPDGKWILQLKAPNNKEIARSPRFDNEASARRLLPSAIALRDNTLQHADAKLERVDDYLACKEYENRPRSEEFSGFTAFEHGGEYYFALVRDNGEVLLRGEGYRTPVARSHGMETVINNKGNKERYKVEEHLGYHFVILTAGNNQEIARSCPKSETAAMGLIALLTAPGVEPIPKEAVEAASTADVPIPTPSRAKWWWWLLPLLFLGLLFLLWRSCNG
jgi:uncharacterized protein YegP (UPF0339 family)